jgi:isopentenyl phosphate kinase
MKAQKLKTKPIILKLGGSVITVKEKPFTPNEEAINRLAKEVRKAEVKSLILVHGGGSFGHPLAKEYKIKEGYRDSSQIVGFSKTRQAMASLNKILLDALIHEGVPAVAVQPSAFIVTNNERIKQMEMETILGLLKLGVTPVLYGDAVLDSALGFTILSGDQLTSKIASELGAEKIVVGVDVDGLYTADPKADPHARLIRRITIEELKRLQHKIGKAEVTDVTGGMLGKILELIPAVARGVKAIIVNASKPDNVYKALKGEEVNGTIIEGT